MERWAQVKGYEGVYEVSDEGRVRRITASIAHAGNLIKKPFVTHNGYFRVPLSMHSKVKTFFVHRLIYTAFIGSIPDKMEINHKNGNKQDNRVDNLELVTSKENKRHAFEVLGIKKEGEKHGMSKLKNSDIPIIRSLIAQGVNKKAIAIQFGVSRDTIFQIHWGKIWTSVK